MWMVRSLRLVGYCSGEWDETLAGSPRSRGANDQAVTAPCSAHWKVPNLRQAASMKGETT
jgi:hypothetical protein